jgi:hypothetical protein
MSNQRTVSELLKDYVAGWTEGNGLKILESTALSYRLDDPNVGHPIDRLTFVQYFNVLTDLVHGLRDPNYRGHFKDISEITTKEELGALTACCWWRIPGTPIQGGSVIKVSESGVLSDKLAFYCKQPEFASHAASR